MDAKLTMLPLARYRLHWRATTPIHFPAYAGSMLRGAFGHALRRISCMTRQRECTGCPLFSTCPYPAIFAPPPVEHALQRFTQIPAPYLIEPPAWGERSLASGDTFSFNLVLCGRALKELPLITLALRQALQRGIGPGDGQAELISLNQEDETLIHTPATGQFAAHNPQILHIPEQDCTEITLHFSTPLRLQENGNALPPNRLTARALLMAVVRRASLMAEFHGSKPPQWDFSNLSQQAATVHDKKDLKWQDWTRRSARQQQTMKLGGVIGRWTLKGNLTQFLPALHIGQWLHVGKETVFGLGQYYLEHKSLQTPFFPKCALQVTENIDVNTHKR
jgi:hypothetical protein